MLQPISKFGLTETIDVTDKSASGKPWFYSQLIQYEILDKLVT